MIPTLTVEENILLRRGHALEATAERSPWFTGSSEPSSSLHARTATFRGQQKLAALARALMCGTRLLLLDEPFEALRRCFPSDWRR